MGMVLMIFGIIVVIVTLLTEIKFLMLIYAGLAVVLFTLVS
jgi:hypothetical protein